ncbi:MAG TPA: alpha/beta hydrolase [Oligoflexus sp.]|uniref:alpha/beta fold hydrolase n=1 Tax=Oligoflexus sp. TaxID=1971216 RepID=UPI002D5D7BE6|nr:alpha/beta hydrolase [Oligoflexus sp.]HYX32414.1 alpha/beta hydrolase [Oligoflexus sp.]
MTESSFNQNYANLKDVRLKYVTLGKGKPVLLLHGVPETSYGWRRLMPLLADDYMLVAPDLRGLGDSSRPTVGYDKKTIARDVWQLMHDRLECERFAVVGHDWGAPVAFRIAADHPDAVTHLALLDMGVLGDEPEGLGVTPRWHHLFLQVLDLPEALIVGRERVIMEFMLYELADKPGAFSDADINEYLRTYSQPGALRAMCEYYRAIHQDIADNRATFATGFKLPMPTLGIGGGGKRGRGEGVVESLRRIARHAEGSVIPDCGHWIHEEQPQELANRLRSFFIQ